MSRRRDIQGDVSAVEDRRRSEAGDTLVEVLITIAVLGIAATALLLAFATSISGSGEHRNLVAMDTMLRTASAEVTAAIQQQDDSTFATCSGAYTLNQATQNHQLGGISLPNPVAPATNPYSVTILKAQYWNPAATPPGFTSLQSPTTSCPPGVTGGGPQLLTVQVSFNGSNGATNSTITTVVDNTTPPAPVSNCGDPATQLVWVSQPGGGNAGTALFPPPTLALEDASGCVELNDASAVTLSVNSGPGTVNNCVSNLGYGETTFQNCTISSPGTYTLIAHDTTDGITSPASNQFTISQGLPVRLVFGTQPGNGTGGSPLIPQPVVFIEDNSGNVVSGDSTTVTLALQNNPSNGTLSGCTSTTLSGKATFAGCKVDKVGTGYTVTATDTADNLTTGTTSNPFSISVGPASQLAFSTTPSTTVAGDAFGTQPVVNILDAGGNQTTSTDAVSLTIGVNAGAGSLSHCSETTKAGVATFSGCLINQPGTGYTLVATDTTTQAVLSATSGPFNIVTPALTSFRVVPSTSTPTAGTAFTVAVTALDQSGFAFPAFTGTQAITFSGPLPSSLPLPSGTAPIYAANINFSNGAGTGSVTLFDAQTTTLTATYTGAQATTSITGTSGNITVSALTAASTYSVSSPGPQVAGVQFSVSISAIDKYGNIVTGYTGGKTLTFSGPSNSPNNSTPTYPTGHFGGNNATFNNGIATALVTLVDAQTTQLKVAQGTAISGMSASFAVSGGNTAGGFTVANPGLQAAGTQFPVNITATDPYGNPASAYSGNQTLTFSGPANSPNGNAPAYPAGGVVSFSGGTGTAQVTLYRASTTTNLNISQSGVTAGTGNFTVSGGTTTAFSLSTPTPTAGIAFNETLTQVDNYGNPSATFPGNQAVTFSGPSPSSLPTPTGTAPIYPSTVMFSAGGAGTASIKLFDAQSTTLQAMMNLVVGTSPTFTVVGGSATTLAVSGFPSPTSAGQSQSVTVAASDNWGNVATGYTGRVAFSSSDAKAVLPASYTFTAGTGRDNGTHTFTGATLNTVGTQSITAADQATSTITGTQSGITVNKATPTISTTLSASSITVGNTAHDASALSGAVSSTGTATVIYSYYTNNTCSSGQVSLPAVTVGTNGSVPNSSSPTFNVPGTYYWQAVYSGDANNAPASSPCTSGNNEQLTVNKATPTISTSLSASPITVGQSANDASTLSGTVNSTGTATVVYSYYTNNNCSAGQVSLPAVAVGTDSSVPNSSAVTFNNAGTYYWQASYSGDTNNSAALSPCTAANNEQLVVSLALSPTTLPAAGIGASYSSAISASGGTSPYTFARTAGTLPAGLTLSTGGVLSGTPTAGGTFTFTVTATDSATPTHHTGALSYTLVVNTPTIDVAPNALPTPSVGTAYSTTVTASGGTSPYTFSRTAGAMPTGLTLSTLGVLSGTPTAGGTFNFTVTATDSSTGTGSPYTGSQAYSVTVSAPTITVNPTTLAAAGVGTAYSTSITGSGGTSPYTYSRTAGALPAGLTLSSAGLLSGTPTAGGSFNFTIQASDSSTGSGPYSGLRAYTLTVAAPSINVTPDTLPAPSVGTAYSVAITASGGTSPYAFTKSAGTLPTGLTLTNGVLSGTPTTAGTFTFTIQASDSSTGSGPYIGTQAYTVTVPLAMSPATLPAAAVASPYGATSITASGGTGTVTYAVTTGALPAGLSLSTGGVLSGTPTAGGSFTFTITATDSATPTHHTGSQSYTLAVSAPSIDVTPNTLPAGTRGTPYSQSVIATGGTSPYAFTRTAGTLPTGLTLSNAGVLSGTPTTVGTFNFTITGTDSSTGTGPYSGTQAYTVTISLALSPTTLPGGTVGTTFTTSTITASGGTGTVTYKVTTGALPTGLSLSTGGVLSGTPTAGGSFNFTITATDSAFPTHNTGSQAYSVTVGAPSINVTPDTLPGGIKSTAYSQTLSASGGTSPYAFTKSTGTLPTGLTLTNGVISGTPTTVGTFTFTITGTDSSTGTGPYAGTQAYTVTISLALSPATLPAGKKNTTYTSTTITASGGTGTVTYKVTTGALPTGLSLSTGGVLSGTPSSKGTFDFTITATDSATPTHNTGSQDYAVTIS